MNFEIETPQDRRKKEKNKKNNIMVFVSLGFLLLAIILVIVYLAMPKPKPEVIPPQPIVEEKPKLQIIDEESDERPIAVMIDNNIGDIKHAGLQDSYINYEIIVEGGLTRIMALYKDKTVSIIGPIRSSRHYFLDYALEHDAIYAHFGWSPFAERDIKQLNVNNINGLTDSNAFVRDKNSAAPHNVYSSTKKLKSTIDTKGYSTTTSNWRVLNYSIDKIYLNQSNDGEIVQKTNLTPAHKVSISYSNNVNRSYTYDSVNEYYLRSQNGKAHLDRNTDNQLNYKNIIIMKVVNKTIDNEGRQELTTTGTGTGFYITNGFALPINWSKQSRTAKTQYSYTDGSEVMVNDGNTFIQIVPTTAEITIE